MSAKSESVVWSAAAPSFQEPKDLDEARARLASARVEIQRMELGLHDKRVFKMEAGRHLTDLEYVAWRRGMRTALRQKSLEISKLKSWVRVNGPTAPDQPNGNKAQTDGKAFRLLWRCGQLLRRLDAEGVDFSPEERAFLAEVTDFTSVKPSELLERARACMAGNVQNFFQFGAMVALATRDEQDLAVLTAKWEEMDASLPRNEDLLAMAGKDYVQALVAYDQLDEALAAVRSLDQTRPEVAFMWRAIARSSGDLSILSHARALGNGLDPQRRGWFFLGLYEFTGDGEDASFLAPESQQSSGKKDGWYRISVMQNHLAWGRLAEARELFSRMINTEERLHALACIVEASEDPEDVEQLIACIAQYKPAKINTMRTVASVLAQEGHGNVVAELLDTMSTWYLKCVGYSVLARFMEDQASEMIDRAEQTVTAAKIEYGTEGSQALFSLVYAQATNGRRPEAIRTAGLITERNTRCKALLLLHALSRGEAIPDFLEDAL